jgi:hypothetical protein
MEFGHCLTMREMWRNTKQSERYNFRNYTPQNYGDVF